MMREKVIIDTDFAAIQEIKAKLKRLSEATQTRALSDLVAIFSPKSGEQMALVYSDISYGLKETIELDPDANAFLLADLADIDLNVYDGVFVGIPALDIIRTSLPTRGCQFYPLERLLLEIDSHLSGMIHLTLHHLAQYLAKLFNSLPENDPHHRIHTTKRIVELALPLLLETKGAEGLVAINIGRDLSFEDLERFIEDGGQWVRIAPNLNDYSLDALEKFDTSDWLIMLEGLDCFNQHCRPEYNDHFIELRQVVLRAGFSDALSQTRKTLAWHCYELSKQEQEGHRRQKELLATAWSLMTEFWLAQEEIDDLVAFFPHADFNHFAEWGDGLRVYRTLNEDIEFAPLDSSYSSYPICPGPRWSLKTFLLQARSSEYVHHGYTLIPLPVNQKIPKAPPEDLHLLLWRAGYRGKTEEAWPDRYNFAMARTSFLFTSENMNEPSNEWTWEAFSDLALQALWLIGYTDPWIAPRGRYRQFVFSSYQALLRSFEKRRQVGSTGDYFEALIAWFSFYYNEKEVVDDVPNMQISKRLHWMIAKLHGFLEQTRTQTESNRLPLYRDNAEQLIDIAEAMLFPHAAKISLRHEGATERSTAFASYESGQEQRVGVKEMKDTICLSPTFEQAWDQLIRLRQERQDVQRLEHDEEVLHNKLEGLLLRTRQQRSLAFALPHEIAILDYLYQLEITELGKSLHESGPTIGIEVITPYIELARQVQVAFEVSNDGRRTVKDLSLLLEESSLGFDFIDTSSIRTMGTLKPGEKFRVLYQVYPTQIDDAIFNFSINCIYSDSSDQSNQLESKPVTITLNPVRLRVRNPDEKGFMLLRNPYNFGFFVDDPSKFYGREAEIRRVLSPLAGDTHSALFLSGPRRMGKSSILAMLNHLLITSDEHRPDLRRRYGIPESWNKQLDYCIPVLFDLQGYSFDFDSFDTLIPHFFRVLLDRAITALAPEKRNTLLEIYDQHCLDRNLEPTEIFLDQLAVIFQQRPQARVLILLDEFDQIHGPAGESLMSKLRYVMNVEQRLSWIITSTLLVYKESQKRGSPLFNIADSIQLGCLRRDAALKLVEEPSEREGAIYRPDAIEQLLSETGLHPAFLQLFCSRIISYLTQEERTFVTSSDISKLVNLLVRERETLDTHFQVYWQDKEKATSGIGQLIMLAVLQSLQPLTLLEVKNWVRAKLQECSFYSQVHTQVLIEASTYHTSWLDRAFDAGMDWVTMVLGSISLDPVSHTYHFTVPLFKRWLEQKNKQVNLLTEALESVQEELRHDGIL